MPGFKADWLLALAMFHGSEFEPQWKSFGLGGDVENRWTPACQDILRSEGDLTSFAGLHAPYLIEKTEYLGKDYFDTGDMVGFYTDSMPAYVELDDIDDRYNAKSDCLSLTAKWKLRDGVTDRGRYYDMQQLILVRFDRPLPSKVCILMDYGRLPLDDASRKAAIVEIPPLTRPSRLNMISINPKLQKLIGVSQPKPR